MNQYLESILTAQRIWSHILYSPSWTIFCFFWGDIWVWHFDFLPFETAISIGNGFRTIVPSVIKTLYPLLIKNRTSSLFSSPARSYGTKTSPRFVLINKVWISEDIFWYTKLSRLRGGSLRPWPSTAVANRNQSLLWETAGQWSKCWRTNIWLQFLKSVWQHLYRGWRRWFSWIVFAKSSKNFWHAALTAKLPIFEKSTTSASSFPEAYKN